MAAGKLIGIKMKKNTYLIILLFFTSFNLVRSQSTSFFEDVQTLKMNLCFKDFILADSNLDQIPLQRGLTSEQIFLRSDSLLVVKVYLRRKSPDVRKSERSMDDLSLQADKSIRSVSKKEEKILKKFGADGGGFEMMEKKSTSRHLSGYALIGGGRLSSRGNLMFLEVYQREDIGKKMSEKALINFASSFIRFND